MRLKLDHLRPLEVVNRIIIFSYRWVDIPVFMKLII